MCQHKRVSINEAACLLPTRKRTLMAEVPLPPSGVLESTTCRWDSAVHRRGCHRLWVKGRRTVAGRACKCQWTWRVHMVSSPKAFSENTIWMLCNPYFRVYRCFQQCSVHNPLIDDILSHICRRQNRAHVRTHTYHVYHTCTHAHRRTLGS